jgi:hypothetical protein
MNEIETIQALIKEERRLADEYERRLLGDDEANPSMKDLYYACMLQHAGIAQGLVQALNVIYEKSLSRKELK